MFKKFINQLSQNSDGRNLAIDYLVDLSDDDYKKTIEAVKLYRKGDSLREEYYDKAAALLSAETPAFIQTPAPLEGKDA